MDKQKIKRLIAKYYPGVYRNGILILNYHSVQPNHDYSLPPEEFEKQMLYLRENYDIISLEDFKNNLKAEKIKAIITFDDGYENNYLYAFPTLKKYSLPATIFLTSDYIFNDLDITSGWPDYKGLKPLKKEQIIEMSYSNINFGSHGKDHQKFSSLSKNEFIMQLKSSKCEIEKHLCKRITSFAFPFGQKKDRGKYGHEVLRETGYEMACTTDWGINKIKKTDFLSLKRIRIDHFDNLDDFKSKLRGKWDFISYIQKVINI